jgi:hypothetical protein
MTQTASKMAEKIQKSLSHFEQNLFSLFWKTNQIHSSVGNNVLVVVSHLQLFAIFLNDKVIS